MLPRNIKTPDVDQETLDALEGKAGDIFTTPPGTVHAHKSFDDASILFGMSDRPILSAFNMNREQR